MEPLSNGHFGTNIYSSDLFPIYRLSSLRGSNHIILIGGIKFGDLVVERYLIQCPFLGGSSLRGYTVHNSVLYAQHIQLVSLLYLIDKKTWFCAGVCIHWTGLLE